MIYRNGLIFQGERGFVRGGFEVEDGIFTRVWNDDSEGCASSTFNTYDTYDLCGLKVIPGLIDIHIHGAMGADFSDGEPSGLRTIAKYLASRGVTSFLPTSMTLPYEDLSAAYKMAAEFTGADCFERFTGLAESAESAGANNSAKLADADSSAKLADADELAKLADTDELAELADADELAELADADELAEPIGINMEGPFLAESRKGSQNSKYLRMPDADDFDRLQKAARGMIKIVTAAPELDGAEEFTRKISRTCRVSAGHTDADYEQAKRFFDAGGIHVTHLFNAMAGIHHREPGLIGAASERDDVTAELICDGYHVHPSAVRMAFRMFPGRICLISDALRCAGMPDGEYELAGQKVMLKDGAARLEDGTLAGSATDLFSCMKNAMDFGIPEVEAIAAATINPAKAAGFEGERGSIEEGKIADFVVCDDEWNIKAVSLRGKPKTVDEYIEIQDEGE